MENKFVKMVMGIAVMLVLAAAGDVYAQGSAGPASQSEDEVKNRWIIRGGVNWSHLYADVVYLDKNDFKILPESKYGYGAGAFLEGAYDIRFNRYWSFTPGIGIHFINNGAVVNNIAYDWDRNITDAELAGIRKGSVTHSWNIVIPLLVNMRAPISRKVGIRVGVGPYLSEAFAVEGYPTGGNGKIQKLDYSFGDSFNLGVMGELAVETGSHLSYFYRVQYPCLKNHLDHRVLTMSLGIGYNF